MTIVGFTAARNLTQEDELTIERVIVRLPSLPEMVVTGACIGGDQFIAEWFLQNFSNVKQKVIVPNNLSQVDRSFLTAISRYPNVEMVYMPSGSSYRERNARIVAECTRLIGFPPYIESHEFSTRSGTWQTIRIGRRMGREVNVHVLSESRSGQ